MSSNTTGRPTRTPSGVRGRAGSTPGLPVVLVLTTVVALSVFNILPLLLSLSDSLTEGYLLSETGGYVGLQNYRAVFDDPAFISASKNPLLYLGLTVVGVVLVGLGLGAWLKSMRRFRGLATVAVL